MDHTSGNDEGDGLRPAPGTTGRGMRIQLLNQSLEREPACASDAADSLQKHGRSVSQVGQKYPPRPLAASTGLTEVCAALWNKSGQTPRGNPRSPKTGQVPSGGMSGHQGDTLRCCP